MKFPKIFQAVSHAYYRGCSSLINKCQAVSQTPLQRKLLVTSALITCTLVHGTSFGQATDGVAGMVKKTADQADASKLAAGVIFAALGFIAVGLGIINWVRKGREGEHSTIKASHIYIPILAGAALGSTGLIMAIGGETIGIDHSTYGHVPT